MATVRPKSAPSKKKTSKAKSGKVKRKVTPTRPSQRKAARERWLLRLYVAGNTQKSTAAIANLTELCETHLKGQYSIEVVDLLRDPKLARGDQILAIPTLVRRLPGPVKRIIGDLSNTERVIIGLDLRPMEPL